MNRYPVEELSKNLLKIISKYFDIYQKLINKPSNRDILNSDPLQLNKLFTKLFNRIISDPNLIIKHQMSFFKRQLKTTEDLLLSNYQSIKNSHHEDDKRFQNKIWQENHAFTWLKNSYFTYTEWMEDILDDLPTNNFTQIEIKRLHFIIKQFLDAISPSNFPTTNPEVLKAFFDTCGENIIHGLDNLLEDIKNSHNTIKIKSNDGSKFIIGKNIAATKGKVVYQNEIMQLLHYTPLTKSQYEIPILIIPPFINKYYILDLQQENSFIKWLLEQNYNVFLISWINPDGSLSKKDFSDYMLEGPIAALNYISNTLNITQVNAMGYCIGGTLLATTLAYMKHNNDTRIKTASFLTTLIDFYNAGDLSIFIDDYFIEETSKYMEKSGGYADGKDISTIFNLLKPNDMIWPFYINNYLLGKDSFPFDILYWNDDPVRIPMALHLFYLKHMYKDNLLKIPGGITIDNCPIDVSKIDIPCFFVATKGDHIVPWNNAFNSSQLFSGPIEFILANSGHVAGIVNHPNKNKYNYWTNEKSSRYKKSKDWFKDASKHSGSWWPYWNKWTEKHSNQLVESKNPESLNPNIIEDAPGSYVKVKY